MPKCVFVVCHVFAGTVLDFDALVAPHARRVATWWAAPARRVATGPRSPRGRV